jgi:hypothetical protein
MTQRQCRLRLAVTAVAGRLLVDLRELLLGLLAPVLRTAAGAQELLGVGNVERRLGQIVAADNHVLRRRRNGSAIGRQQDVVAGQHQHPRLKLCLEAERQVHGHLVTIEVGVERRTDERVDADGLALHQHRLERLDAEAVQRRRTVQQHRVVADDAFQNLIYARVIPFHQLLRALHRLRLAALLQLMDDERLEQLHRHQLRQAALVQLQLGTHDDHRTARIVYSLAEQVLAEAALLALQHVRERLEGTLAAAADRLAATTIVEQCVHGFLQHPLLVAQDHFRRTHLHQLLQPVVPVDDAPVEVVQVGRREAATVERDQRSQVRRYDRYHVHDHPLGSIARLRRGAAVADGVDDLEPLQLHLLAMLARLRRNLAAQLIGQPIETATILVAILEVACPWCPAA